MPIVILLLPIAGSARCEVFALGARREGLTTSLMHSGVSSGARRSALWEGFIKLN
jgi:hypothetical protein